ncbi:hypothetical protein ACIQXF_15185 [Lysinibacillus sp. NPDC097231]|uniref:hypothetical protein n=1 Tax=Lysinibacillus sp. NPDC097231 TaxID=3364142 RepID=UPI0038260939
MKNNIKSFLEFEDRLKNEAVPQPSYEQILVDKIMNCGKWQRPIYTRVSVVLVFFTIFITASIATAMELTGWQLFNNEGKQILTVDNMAEQEAEKYNDIRKIFTQYDATINELKANLPEGKFFYFLVVEAYEKYGLTSVHSYQNDLKINNINQIPMELKEKFHLSEDLLGANSFSEGSISYKQPDMELEEAERRNKAMYLEAKEKNVPYIVKEETLKLTSEIASLSLKYHNGFDYAQININPSVSGAISINSTKKREYNKFEENGLEFLFNKESPELIFVKEDDGQNYIVNILGSKLPNEKETDHEKLMSVARKILNW